MGFDTAHRNDTMVNLIGLAGRAASTARRFGKNCGPTSAGETSPCPTPNGMWRGLLLAMVFTLLVSDRLNGDDRATPAVKLLAHWPLREDARDIVGSGHARPENVKFADGGAHFNV